MESLLSGMLSKMGDKGLEQLAQSAGLDAASAKTILEQAGPLLIGKMANNTKSKEGLESLDDALQNHDGSIFNHIEDVVNSNINTKGDKILGHILGGNVGNVVDALSSQNETDSGSTGKLLEMAAPLILGQLGSQKKLNGLDASGLFDLLQGEKKLVESGGSSVFMNLAKNFLDKDGDGNIKDDLLGMAGDLFKK